MATEINLPYDVYVELISNARKLMAVAPTVGSTFVTSGDGALKNIDK
jgi:hypothetical protein